GEPAEVHVERDASVSLRRSTPHRPRAARLRGDPEPSRRRGVGRGENPRLASGAGEVGVNASNSGSFFVPHDLEAPVVGSASGPLAGLTAVVKDLYDVAGTRTGGGSPEWLGGQKAGRA